ncbi:MAG: hypothetical protein RL536_315 [Candidatus Parcubacteria bacterium]|jgi:Fic family protein
MNKKFQKRLDDLPPDIIQTIDKIDQLKTTWAAGAELDREVLTRLKKSVLITSTGASTRIEGAQLSDDEVEKLLRGMEVSKFRDRDKQEVLGYYELLNNVFDSYKSIPFSESTIKFFHRELLKHVEKDKKHRGEYKKGENKVAMVDSAGNPVEIVFDTTSAYLTPKEMQEIVEWTQLELIEKKYHPLLIIGIFLVEFLQIHPFTDGNGRLSRILTNLLLLQQGFEYMPYVSHEKLVEDNKPEYYLALRQSQKTFGTDKETIAPWLRFLLNMLLEQSKRAVELLSREQIEKLLSPQQEVVWKYLEGVGESTPIAISKSTNVPRPTINQVLTKLLRLKKIERVGSGRGTRYRVI